MGRPVSYEFTEVLRRAADVFRRKGFHAASIQNIVDATGINRFAIYDRFGGKEGLFYAALEFYVDISVKRELLGCLRGEQPGLSELIERLEFMRVVALRPEEPSGCLVINASIELGGLDPRVERTVASFCSAMQEAFSFPLNNAEKRKELIRGRSTDARARYLVTMTNAFMVLAHVSRQTADEYMQAVIAEVESWRQTPCA